MRNSNVFIISEQCSRDHMEDKYSFTGAFGAKKRVFGGVYDGHGGANPAIALSERIANVFCEQLQGLPPEKAFVKAYKAMHKQMPWAIDCGACAANFFIDGKTIFHANAGDCRIVVVGNGITELTTLHRPSNEKERQRVIAAGGDIVDNRVATRDFTLAPTRAIGDLSFAEAGVIPTPSVGSYKIKPSDKFLIAGSDGLFDAVSNEALLKASARVKTARSLASRLERLVSLDSTGDNLTIIVLKLNN